MEHIMSNKTLLIKSPINSHLLIYVTGIFTTEKAVNKYLKSEKGKEDGVLAVYGEFIFTAKNTDLGKQIPTNPDFQFYNYNG